MFELNYSTIINFVKSFIEEYQFMLIATLIVFLLEFALGKKKYLEHSKKSNEDNLKYFFVNYIIASKPIEYLTHFFILANLQTLFQDTLLFGTLKNLTPIWSFLVAVVIYDFLQFNVHYFNHKFDFLWQFHKAHHAVNRLNVTAHFRGNLFSESILILVFAELPLIMLGIPANTLMQVIFIYILISIFVHADLKYKFPLLSKFIVTPQLHLWHHAVEKKTHIQQNIGSMFNIWDRIYGVYYYTDQHPESVGLSKDDDYPKNAFKQMVYPFIKFKN